mmetsp:Transcript_30835/g.30377  ORF Transcript_30835/g.30377 Transcript_30835/m.30377 type:complete len:190 (-) Transcript_30835:195-764(-)|eukprot:CAMPEP_0197018620 /NCGR_PEP_ID=MMETSP1380-20130617/80202_1 /TAXON_ID=5936 /ORGANISM="Euplotes crassus, Strain CT5" /LENGTH=189 /DNA_ID=CAMNT_0042445869 /DNA_START=1137 /DNA_END=1706 /DNA_ORIENTATION=-
MKSSKKISISEDSESPLLRSSNLKGKSNPIMLFKTGNKKFDIPIRMPKFDDTSSITISEENTHKTPSEDVDLERMLKKCSPKTNKNRMIIKHSLSKENDELKDSNDPVFPTMRNQLIAEKRSSCKNIPVINHFKLNRQVQKKYHPNQIQEKVNREREMNYLKSTIGSTTGLDNIKTLEVNIFKAPRKSS